MDKKSTKKKEERNSRYFPGDPRYGVQERLLRQDVGALADEEILNTRILNCLIQRAAPPPAETSCNKILLGSLSETSEVVPCESQIVKIRWDASAVIQVMEIERRSGDFKAIKSLSGREESVDNEDVIANMPMLSGGQHSVHIVKPNSQWCSCEIWQDYLYPCHHACAVYRK